MRVLLDEYKQKELIDLAKSKSKLSWDELGHVLSVNPGYLSGDIRFENVSLSHPLYRKLCEIAKVNFNSYILSKLPENWGQIKGGKLATRKPRPRKILVEKPSKHLAEAIGIILGDGSLYCNSKHGVNQVVITGHIKNDKIYLLKIVKSLFEDLFKTKFYTRIDRKKNAIRLYNQKTDVLYTLQNFGLPSGNKIQNNIGIPNWVFKSKSFLKACVRGLIDTDGSVFPITGRNYTYIEFKSASAKLRSSFQKAMDILGFKTSKWSKSGTPTIYIANKKDIARYYYEIGFNNPYHKSRFMLPSSSPVKEG